MEHNYLGGLRLLQTTPGIVANYVIMQINYEDPEYELASCTVPCRPVLVQHQ
jgi:hypothetical protein